MLQNIVPRRPEEIVEYSIDFMYEKNCGLGFDCDENGNIEFACEAAKANYEYAMSHPEEYPYCFNKLTKRTRTFVNPAYGTCYCGNTVTLENEYMGACQCSKCGRWYNLFGQMLKDPKYWEED